MATPAADREPRTKTYDVIVIGGGPGGYGCAIRLGQLKQKVLCVEKEEVGGVCLNWGCIPSQGAHRRGAHLREGQARRDDGPASPTTSRVDASKMQDWKDGIVKKLTGGVAGLLRGNGVELARRRPRAFRRPNTVEVKTREGGTETIEATKAIVIATGATTIEIPSFKFDGKQIIGAAKRSACATVPKRLLVIGGGVIGLELGMVYQTLGSELTVVEMTPTLLPGIDPDLHGGRREQLVKHGAKILKNAKAMGYEKQADGSLAVKVDFGGGKTETVVVRRGARRRRHAPATARASGSKQLGVKVERGLRPHRRAGPDQRARHLRHRRRERSARCSRTRRPRRARSSPR